jgi:hypothetical protein
MWLLPLLAIPAQSQVLEKLSGSAVYLQEKEQQTTVKDGKPVTGTMTKFGTGFLVGDENNTLFLVTAQHVASDMKSERTATIRGEGDTPINMPPKIWLVTRILSGFFTIEKTWRSLFCIPRGTSRPA